MSEKKFIDWEAIEREYRAGVRSLRDIAAEFGITDTAIRKRARRDEWCRDLSAKVAAKADALVRKAEVRSEVRSGAVIPERELVDASALVRAESILSQRSDIKRARATTQKLWLLADAELDHPEEFAALGKMMASPDESGQDKLNEMYRAAIGLPQQIKNVKLLADAIKVLIELERRVLKIDELPDNPFDAAAEMSDAQRVSRIASILAKAKGLAEQ